MLDFIKTDSEEVWLELRKKDVTSTESAALFGISPYITELELFYRKQTGESAEFTENNRMRAGRLLEPAIAQMAADDLGCDVEPFKEYGRDETRMGSSFDFKITTGKYQGWLLEIKNVDFLIYRDQWEDDEAPDHIEVQCQHQLELTGRDGIIIACLVGGNELKLIVRPRNEKMGRGIRQAINRFWQSVADNNPPKPDFSRDADFIISLHQRAGDKVESVEEGSITYNLIKEYRFSRQVAIEADKQSKALKAEILDMIGDGPNKVLAGLMTLSCGEIAETEVEAYTRKGYRNFRVTEKKPKKEKK
jgi:putative phage-type endonuclease